MPELRCDWKLHGILLANGELEVKCNSKRCGAEPGVTVLHRFDPVTGTLLDTKIFKDPGKDLK